MLIDVAPMDVENVPGGQSEQTELPVVFAKDPAVHEIQAESDVAPVPLKKVPTGQGLNVVCLLRS